MASQVDIGNLALAHLGQAPTITAINPPDGSAVSLHVAQMYNIALDMVLAECEWTFATKQEQLTAVSVTMPDQWEYAFAVPSDLIMPLRLVYDDLTDPNVSLDFTIVGQTLFCNTDEVWLNYIYRNPVTADYPMPFVMALSYYLAHLIAAPLRKEAAAAQAMLQLYRAALGDAMVKNMGRSRNTLPYDPAGIAARWQ